MLSFLAPGFLVAAGLVALGVVALHFLSTRDPRLELLPTTRFIPDVPVQATAVTVRPSDWLLLLLRVALVLLVGAALARPVITPARRPLARILAVDVSRAVGRPVEVVDSARRFLAGAEATILFDSAARELSGGAEDSLTALAKAARPAAAKRGSLSAALISALRVAARLRDGVDSLELVIVSPFAAEERDAATATIRGLWPGRVTAVQVAAATVAGRRDSLRVEWAESGASALWTARATPDTIGAARAGDAVLVDPFVRRWRPAAAPDSTTRVFARWADGEPAGLERASAAGCVRSIAISLPTEGDALLRPDFQRFLSGLAAPCGEPRDFAPLPAAFMTAFRGEGPLAPSAAVIRRVERVTPLMPWLLGAGVLLALLELFVRGWPARAESTPENRRAPAGSAASRVA
jgi:hypothetical protein